MTDLEKVKNILLERDASLVVYKDGKITEYYNNGIKDLIIILNENADALNGSIIADKVIGRVAASIMVKAGVKEMYAKVISKLAIPILEENNIKFEYNKKIKYIQNRDKTGVCPMESRFQTQTNLDAIWNEYINL